MSIQELPPTAPAGDASPRSQRRPTPFDHDDRDEHPAGERLVRAPFWVRVTTALFVVVPLLALVLGIVLLWGMGVGWPHLILLGVGYVLTGLGITVGYHRLFTHKSFTAHPAVRAIFGVLGSMAAEGPLS